MVSEPDAQASGNPVYPPIPSILLPGSSYKGGPGLLGLNGLGKVDGSSGLYIFICVGACTEAAMPVKATLPAV
jgi:hypothetical protein